MTSGTSVRTPTLGDRVFLDGLWYRLVAYTPSQFEVASDLQTTRQRQGPGSTTYERVVPRFRQLGNSPDLRWSEALQAWYLWGRLLSKGRKGVGEDERQIVAELRDRRLLPARTTRRDGSGPAGGEHINLRILFDRGIRWRQEIDNVRRGEGLSANARAAIAEYETRYRRRLPEGYASPDADDSSDEEG